MTVRVFVGDGVDVKVGVAVYVGVLYIRVGVLEYIGMGIKVDV